MQTSATQCGAQQPMKLPAYVSPSRRGIMYFRWPLPMASDRKRRSVRLPALRQQDHLYDECNQKPEQSDQQNHENTRQLPNRSCRNQADLTGNPKTPDGASENSPSAMQASPAGKSMPPGTSSQSCFQNGSTDDPFQPHGLRPIHRVSDTPQPPHYFIICAKRAR